MSLRTCCTLFPGFVRSLRTNKISHINFAACITSKNSHNVLLYSTEKKPPDAADQKEIYYGVLTPQIKAVKLFSLSSSVVGIVGQPFLYSAVVSTGNVPIIVAAYSFIGFFTFVTPFLLHLITKKYVTHLLYKPETDSYIARTVNFFCMTKEMYSTVVYITYQGRKYSIPSKRTIITEFKKDDVNVPDVPGMFTTLYASGKPLFLDPRLFENPEHYARIMGYDKPMDFKLYETPPPEEKKGQ